MPVLAVNASSDGRFLSSLASTSMYSGQLDQLSFFSVAEASAPTHAAFSDSVFFAGFVPHAASAPPDATRAPPASRPRMRVRRERPVASRMACASGESGGFRTGGSYGSLGVGHPNWGVVTGRPILTRGAIAHKGFRCHD